jgi:2-polyprenyl-6-methoxyphenol hydroxylase-like FAD-dependent oxidoreductase
MQNLAAYAPDVIQRCMKNPTAEIAGAGLAGLAAAVALAQNGWRVRVHERAAQLREIGAGIYLFENALNALRAFGVYDKVAACGVRSEQPRLLLESGPGLQADLVVAADGVFSSVRDSLGLTARMMQLNDGCGRHLIARRAGDSVNQRRVEMWNGGRRVGIAPASRDQHYVFLCCSASDTAGRMQQPFNLAAWTDSHGLLAEYLERLPRNPPEFWRPFFNVSCSAWSKGRVCVIGDAAHAMAPNLGQGAGVSLVSAMVLVRCLLAARDVPEGLRRWERSEQPYITLTQQVSYRYGLVGTRWPRRLLARKDFFQRSLRCAVDHQPVS